MKKVFLMLAMTFLAGGAVFAETYAVKPEASAVKWEATKVTGRHDGHVKVISGSIVFDGGVFKGGEAVVDTASITVDDIQDPESNAKLTRHLKSPDFFDAENFPQALIKVTSVEPAGEVLYNVTADLTLKGITKSVTFPATVVKTPDGIQAAAEITVDRTQYDIRYGSGKFFENLGDRMIHDTFKLDVSISAA